MRYLGIDYGAERVGLALSDESGKIAFPESILLNRKDLVEKIANLCGQKKVGKIVLGESLNYKREDNQIMGEIREFKQNLETKTGLEIILEPEWLTSMQAKRALDGQNNSGKNKKTERIDDSAAALILQTYLDRL